MSSSFRKTLLPLTLAVSMISFLNKANGQATQQPATSNSSLQLKNFKHYMDRIMLDNAVSGSEIGGLIYNLQVMNPFVPVMEPVTNRDMVKDKKLIEAGKSFDLRKLNDQLQSEKSPEAYILMNNGKQDKKNEQQILKVSVDALGKFVADFDKKQQKAGLEDKIDLNLVFSNDASTNKLDSNRFEINLSTSDIIRQGLTGLGAASSRMLAQDIVGYEKDQNGNFRKKKSDHKDLLQAQKKMPGYSMEGVVLSFYQSLPKETYDKFEALKKTNAVDFAIDLGKIIEKDGKPSSLDINYEDLQDVVKSYGKGLTNAVAPGSQLPPPANPEATAIYNDVLKGPKKP